MFIKFTKFATGEDVYLNTDKIIYIDQPQDEFNEPYSRVFMDLHVGDGRMSYFEVKGSLEQIAGLLSGKGAEE